MNINSLSFNICIQSARLGFALAGAVAVCGSSAYAGGIIIDSDEWALSDYGFGVASAGSAANYADNSAKFLTGGSGSVLIYSSDFALTGTDLQGALTTGGYSVTLDQSVSTPFTASTLSAYKAVFLGGNLLSSAEITALTQYENSGGGVYIAAGTGSIPGSSVGEAALWNSFLNSYGLSLSSSYNGIDAVLSVVSSSPIFNGVPNLDYNNGNSIISATGSSKVIWTDNGEGLIATYTPSSVPDESSTVLLAGLSLALLVFGTKYSRLEIKALRV
jgi:hypothetical protein